MPIVDVELVLREGEMLAVALARDLADAIGEVFAAPPGRTWVRLRSLPIAQYAEHGGTSEEEVRPVFVGVLKSQRPTGARWHDEVRRLTEAIAHAVGRPPEHVHVLYEPEARGRIAFGGEVVE
jgi:phenylpyruvate tautomerase PptA (4-oxalocrotonate tautomerase family)